MLLLYFITLDTWWKFDDNFIIPHNIPAILCLAWRHRHQNDRDLYTWCQPGPLHAAPVTLLHSQNIMKQSFKNVHFALHTFEIICIVHMKQKYSRRLVVAIVIIWRKGRKLHPKSKPTLSICILQNFLKPIQAVMNWPSYLCKRASAFHSKPGGAECVWLAELT